MDVPGYPYDSGNLHLVILYVILTYALHMYGVKLAYYAITEQQGHDLQYILITQ